jgi:adenylate kinase
VPERELIRRIHSRRICASCGATADAEGFEIPSEDGQAVSGQTSRNSCRRCGGPLVQRADDSEGVVRERLKVYERDTQPLLEFYRTRPTFRTVNGAQPPDRVFADLAAVVDSLTIDTGAPTAVTRAEPRL